MTNQRLLHWRNLLRLGLLATGVYLWNGGTLGPPPCKIEEAVRRRTPDDVLEVTLAACGTPTTSNLRRRVEEFAERYNDTPKLRVRVLSGSRARVQRAVREDNTEYVMRNNMATYERMESGEFFIDTHRVHQGESVAKDPIVAQTMM